MTRRRPQLVYCIAWIAIIAAELAIARQFLNAPSFYDDNDEISYVRAYTGWYQALGPDCYGFLRPVKNLAFYVVDRLAPGRVPVWHLLSLGAFVACTIIAFYWFRRRLGSSGWALAASAVWALSPTQVSAVAWFSCANIVIGAGSVLSASLLLDRYREYEARGARVPRYAALAGVLVTFALALTSYESYIIAPALLWVQDRYNARARSRVSIGPYVGMAVLAALFLVLRMHGQARFRVSNESFGPMAAWQVSAASGWITLDHLGQYIWPFGHQSINGTFVWGVTTPVWLLAAAWVVAVGAAIAAIALRKRAPLVSFGVAWFALAFLPTSNLLPFRNGPFADYYLFLPSAGLALCIAGLVRGLLAIPRSRPAWAAAALLGAWRIAAASLCFGWAHTWNNEVELFRRTLAARPDAYTARASIARSALLAGHLTEAHRLIDTALRQAPWFSQAHYVIGDVYLRQGRVPDALAEYREALRLNPNAPYPYLAIGFIQDRLLHDPESAIQSYARALRFRWNQSSAPAAQNLALVLARSGRLDQALSILDDALRHEPDSDPLRRLEGICRNMRDRAHQPGPVRNWRQPS